jgi:hypothetical protein
MRPRVSGMDAEDPVAVEVKEVVVAPASRPVAGMQQGLIVHIRHGAAVFGHHLEEPPAAIRVHERINDDDEALAQPFGAVVVRGDQVMEQGQRGIRSLRFVAVDGVAEPGHGGQFADQPFRFRFRQVARVGQLREATLDLLEAFEVRGSGHDHIMQGAAFVAAAYSTNRVRSGTASVHDLTQASICSGDAARSATGNPNNWSGVGTSVRNWALGKKGASWRKPGRSVGGMAADSAGRKDGEGQQGKAGGAK